MALTEEKILKATKEIVVKFIETGRVSPTGFPEIFKNIYEAIDKTVKHTANNQKSQAEEKE